MHNIDTTHTRVRVYAYCMNARSTHHGCMHIYVCILASMHTTREYSSRCRKYYSTSSHQCNIIYILRLVVYTVYKMTLYAY